MLGTRTTDAHRNCQRRRRSWCAPDEKTRRPFALTVAATWYRRRSRHSRPSFQSDLSHSGRSVASGTTLAPRTPSSKQEASRCLPAPPAAAFDIEYLSTQATPQDSTVPSIHASPAPGPEPPALARTRTRTRQCVLYRMDSRLGMQVCMSLTLAPGDWLADGLSAIETSPGRSMPGSPSNWDHPSPRSPAETLLGPIRRWHPSRQARYDRARGL